MLKESGPPISHADAIGGRVTQTGMEEHAMLHKGFTIEASERQPGQWVARISHSGGPLLHDGREVDRYETRDYPTDGDAVQAAKSEIDFLRVRQRFVR